ncbi:Hsp70 family protein [Thalassoglobus sp.]|uniref:hsp70 family protein n=1 Tax=Thalassoglobus sp. TaxID=2795869 RepID=UPI003AA7EFF4
MTAEPQVETSAESRFVVGIDLGTTNSALCFVDTQQDNWQVETFAVPQLVAPGQVESRETLPSFHYQAAQDEFSENSLSMPWDDSNASEVVGLFAREQGKLVPGRVIESAKSWLCHAGVDRTSPLLPWHGSSEVEMLSPVEVSSKYLSHLRDAWNAAHPDAPLEAQDVVVTLPASFDEVARELTVEAARKAGLNRVLLIEEPQAAFYAWINSNSENWAELVSPGQTILVCDIGGGTSDFTLIRVRSDEDDKVQFHRVAVGDHLILGGDNLDLALAQHVEQKLDQAGKLSPRQWGSLIRICRHAKETLLSPDAPESYSISLSGGGSKLIGDGLQCELKRDEVHNLLLSGFFPEADLHEKPQQVRSGFQEFGLPYAADAGITRYLASFLSDHVQEDADQQFGATRPDVVLFNGGAFLSPLIQERIVHQIKTWFRGDDSDWAPNILENERHDLAVSRGAAYYGMVRRGKGVRIAAGLPRTYYLGVGVEEDGEAQLQALTLMPAGAEPGFEAELDDFEFDLRVASPVEFPLFYSSTRLTDSPGELIEIEREQMSALPPIRTVLRSRKEKEAVTIPVVVHAKLNEIGTLQLWCSEEEGSRSWQLQFDVRSATQTDLEGHTGEGEAAGVLDQQVLDAAAIVIQNSFGRKAAEKPSGIAKRLARTLQMSKEDWPPSLLRKMWDELMECEASRTLSADHESRWLNLLGYSLRPGFGVAMDDWRVMEVWKGLKGKLNFTGSTSLTEWWILWRRIAGGLPTGQQIALALPVVTNMRDKVKKYQRALELEAELDEADKKKRPGKRNKRRLLGRGNTHEVSESWRMIGSFERLPLKMKIEAGDLALATLEEHDSKAIEPALLWTIGRLGARQPFYGPLNGVVPIEVVENWINQLMIPRKTTTERRFAVMQLARKTGDRYRDIDDSLRDKIVVWLTEQKSTTHFIELVQSGGQLGSREEEMAFGESLPVGLGLRKSI